MRRSIRIILLISFGFLLLLPWMSIMGGALGERRAQTEAAQMESLPLPEVIVITDSVPQSCEWAALNISGTPAQRVDEPEEHIIDQRVAELVADRAIHQALNDSGEHPPSHVYGPLLLRAVLPNGESRLVWARVWSTYPTDRDAVVYLDAVTGEPLVIFRGMYLGDPFFGTDCTTYSMDDNLFSDQDFMILGAVMCNVLVLLLAGIAALFLKFRASRR
jgi:hypothetical protein